MAAEYEYKSTCRVGLYILVIMIIIGGMSLHEKIVRIDNNIAQIVKELI